MVDRLALLRGAADRGEPPAFMALLEELRLPVGQFDNGVQHIDLHTGDGAGLEPQDGDRLAALTLLLLLEPRAGLRSELRARTHAVLRLDCRREALGYCAHRGDIRASTTPRASAADGEQHDRRRPRARSTRTADLTRTPAVGAQLLRSG